MERLEHSVVSRRRLIVGGLALGVPAVLAACSSSGDNRTSRPSRGTGGAAGGSPSTLAPTPACRDGGRTEAQTEGPFFEPDSPEKADFSGDVSKGTPIVLSGAVLTTDCRPIGQALLDVWHADADGQYDNDGYRLRGHFFTDDQGGYTLRTIVPGLYPGRTRHFHVKVRPPGGSLLTTQLYFPGESRNEEDSIFSPELLMAVRDSGPGKDATFNFVV